MTDVAVNRLGGPTTVDADYDETIGDKRRSPSVHASFALAIPARISASLVYGMSDVLNARPGRQLTIWTIGL